MGTVYAAFDRERGLKIAVKSLTASLQTMDAERLRMFKQEFRAVQDLQHPNLVQLGELFEEEGHWFFTMELVEGIDFLSFVRSAPAEPAEEVTSDVDLSEHSPRTGGAAAMLPRTTIAAAAKFHEMRLRSALAQLTHGLRTLHQHGKVHRDIKPSNLMVTEAGRLVILDFGIASDLKQSEDWAESRTIGTIQYMAPEQAAGQAVSPAADWYSVGVVLYQVLTGQLPFSGSGEEILTAIRHREPTPVHELVPSVPYDLARLCTDLLSRDPSARPTPEQILDRLQVYAGSVPAVYHPPSEELFIGRQEEISALRQAFADTRKGQGVTLLLSGESGVGKSFLVRHFLREIGHRHRGAVVLSGRCYERESVPYKAIDAAIDRLGLYLQHLPESESQPLWPTHFGLLAKLFPVLEPLLQPSGGPAVHIPEPAQMRRYAFMALRELFGRMARRAPLVLVIDDLQWADADSFVLLTELLRPPEPPPLLLLATVRTGRTDDLGASRPQPQALPGEVRRLHIRKLPDADARALVLQLLGSADTGAERLADQIAREAQGHPLFIDELVRVRRQHHGPSVAAEAAPLRLDDALWQRAQQMDSSTRKLLEVIALAGVPIAQETALLAAAAEPAHFDTQLAELRAARLIRSNGARRSDTIEPYHDRVRESVQAHLSEQAQKIWHGRLALALETLGTDDPEALVIHWLGAGHPERSAAYAEKAAEQASAALAFERAARLYRQALEIGAATGARRRELLVQLAEALHNADRGFEAAQIFLQAAEDAPAQQASVLRRRAAEQLLRSGHHEEGVAAMQQALHDLGLGMPTSMPEIIGSLAMHRTWLSLRGLHFTPRPESEIDGTELARLDALLACGNTFGVVDPLRGMEFASRQALRALRAGEPSRVIFALLVNATGLAVGGGQDAWERSELMMDRARELLRQTDKPYPHAFLLNMDGIRHLTVGNFRAGLQLLDQAEKIYRERCIGVGWDLATLRIQCADAAYFLGDLQRMTRELSQGMEDGERRGDLYLQTCLGIATSSFFALMRDDPQGCRNDVSKHVRNWRYPGFSHYHVIALWRTVHSYLYERQGHTAYRHLHDEMPKAGKVLVRLVPSLRMQDTDLRARCAIAAAQGDPRRRSELLREAERHAQALDKEQAIWAEGLGAMVRAGAAAVRGAAHKDEALRALAHAEKRLLAGDRLLHTQAVRYRRGQLLGGAQGQALLSESQAWMQQQGIVQPARMVAMLLPGFPD